MSMWWRAAIDKTVIPVSIRAESSPLFVARSVRDQGGIYSSRERAVVGRSKDMACSLLGSDIRVSDSDMCLLRVVKSLGENAWLYPWL